jgi:hypothetical protein
MRSGQRLSVWSLLLIRGGSGVGVPEILGAYQKKLSTHRLGHLQLLYLSHNMVSMHVPYPCLILCSFPIVVVSLKPDYLLNMARTH